jgi:hypothetical protein
MYVYLYTHTFTYAYSFIHTYRNMCVCIKIMHMNESFIHVRRLSQKREGSYERCFLTFSVCLLLPSFSVSRCLCPYCPKNTRTSQDDINGLQTAHMRLVRTINSARNPRPACGVGSRSRVDMCHIWPTMCAAATGIFGHTCWPSLSVVTLAGRV